jgi:hypothetical protein
MPNVNAVTVPNGSSAIAWSRGSGGTSVQSVMFANPDLVNTVYLGTQQNITPTSPNVIPLLPNGTFSGDANENWYVTGAAAGISPLVVVPNGQAYFLGVSAGLGKLVIPQLQSPNFVTGVSGWIIRKDGSAEFNNVVIRDGSIVSGSALYYQGTPALNTLVASISDVLFADAFGNVIQLGVTAYQVGDSGHWVSLEGESVNFSGGGTVGGTNTGNVTVNVPSSANYLFISGGGFNSTGGTPANPSVLSTDTWHSMALLHGWAEGNAVQCQYRLVASPPNSVEVIGSLNGAGETSAVFATLPYIPASAQMVPAYDTTVAATGIAVVCDTSGNLSIVGSSLINRYTFHGFISLDA